MGVRAQIAGQAKTPPTLVCPGGAVPILLFWQIVHRPGGCAVAQVESCKAARLMWLIASAALITVMALVEVCGAVGEPLMSSVARTTRSLDAQQSDGLAVSGREGTCAQYEPGRITIGAGGQSI